ncbi:MAG: hypothetical protein AABZ74_06210 [Cyanobacteriota bacterium]
MKIQTFFAYLSTIIFILISLIILFDYKNQNIWNYFKNPIIITLTGSVFFTLVNFKISDILGLIKDLNSNKENDRHFFENKKIILNTFWKNILSFSSIVLIMALILTLGNLEDTSKLGNQMETILFSPLYCLIIRFFIVLPLETAINKRIILLNLSSIKNYNSKVKLEQKTRD